MIPIGNSDTLEIYIIFLNYRMSKIKLLAVSILISFFLVPTANIFAQETEIPEEQPILYQEEETQDEYDFDVSELADDSTITMPKEISKPSLAIFIASMGIFIIFPLLVGLATYIFTSLALAKIGKELGYKNTWFAWIPLLSSIMQMQLGEKSAWWLLVPFVGQIMAIIAIMRITERRGYDKLLGLIILTGIGGYVLYYLLAWNPKASNTTTDTTVSQPSIEEQIQQAGAATLQEEQPILTETIQPSTAEQPVPVQPAPPIPPVTQ